MMRLCVGVWLVIMTIEVAAEAETAQTLTVWAVPGGDSNLPCNLTQPKAAGDTIGMVMWFKDSANMPLYTLDFRNGPLVHWAVSDDLGSRSHFVLDEKNLSNAHLAITKVSKEDQGLYRCRIDFINSPTKNYKVNLTVAESPNDIRLYDGEGREILGNSAGPFREGYDLLISCQVMGGHPKPEVTWWRGSEPLDSLVDHSNRESVISQLYLSSLSRNLTGSKLQCRADTINLLPPLTKEVTLRLYLKPLMAKIKTSGLVKAQHEKSFVCITRGSRPAPNIDWFLESKKIDTTKTAVEVNGDVTKSVLTWAPRRTDDGKRLSCRVSNPWFQGHSLEDQFLLDVSYSPHVNMTLKANDNPSMLREDDDATLECAVKAKPPAHNFTFFKENTAIRHDPIAGFVINGSSLMLRDLQRHHSANYKCRAFNTEGHGDSSVVTINVLYRPTCAAGNTVSKVRGTGGEVRARCAVSAPPQDMAGHLRFYWTYNSTKDVLPIPASNVTVSGNVSTVIHGIEERYTYDNIVKTKDLINNDINDGDMTDREEEIGWLACWASNDIGNQKEPCLYRIVPADLPSPPKNCEILIETNEIRCEPGDDGGLKQHFVLEVVEVAPSPTALPIFEDNDLATMNDQAALTSVAPVYKARGQAPVFPLNALPRGKRYVLMVYSETEKGRSPRPALAHYADADAPPSGVGPLQVLTPKNSSDTSMGLIVGSALTLVLLSLLSVLCASIIVMCKKRRPPPRRDYFEQPQTRNVGVCMYSGGSVMASSLPLQLGAVMVRPGSITTGSVRGSRHSARWSTHLEEMTHIAVLTPVPNIDGYCSTSSADENEQTETILHS